MTGDALAGSRRAKAAREGGGGMVESPRKAAPETAETSGLFTRTENKVRPGEKAAGCRGRA